MSGKTYCLIWIDIPFTTRLPGKQYNNNFPSVWFENNLSVLTASGDMKLHCFPDSCKYSGLIYLCKYFLCNITTINYAINSTCRRSWWTEQEVLLLGASAQVERIHNRNTDLPFTDAYNQNHIYWHIKYTLRRMGLKGRIERCT